MQWHQPNRFKELQTNNVCSQNPTGQEMSYARHGALTCGAGYDCTTRIKNPY